MRYLISTFVLLVFLSPVIATSYCEEAAEDQLIGILQSVPDNWWDGGWDKLSELRDFISQNTGKPALCAKAQYYVACYYYSIKDCRKAMEEYAVLLSTYPSVVSECSKAQFEIAQINFNYLGNLEEAIKEYQKVVSVYAEEPVAPLAQLMIGRAYLRLGDAAQAKAELQKVITDHPLAKTQVAQAYVDLGDLAVSENAPGDAVSYYKKAYLICPSEEASTNLYITEKIYEGLRNLDSSVSRANQFIKFQKYGSKGLDGVAGTGDDISNPLAEF